MTAAVQCDQVFGEVASSVRLLQRPGQRRCILVADLAYDIRVARVRRDIAGIKTILALKARG